MFISSPLHTHLLSDASPGFKVAVFGAYSVSHFLHCDSAVLAFDGLNVFKGHCIHVDDPFASWYVPSGHALHAEDLFFEV